MTKAARKRVLVDRDRMNNSPSHLTASDTVQVFSSVQHLPKERQLLSLACAFALLVDAVGISPQDVFTSAKNLMADKKTESGLRPQFRAMEYHLETELLND